MVVLILLNLSQKVKLAFNGGKKLQHVAVSQLDSINGAYENTSLTWICLQACSSSLTGSRFTCSATDMLVFFV